MNKLFWFVIAILLITTILVSGCGNKVKEERFEVKDCIECNTKCSEALYKQDCFDATQSCQINAITTFQNEAIKAIDTKIICGCTLRGCP